MPGIHGKDADFRVDNSAGTLTDISTDTSEVSLERTIDQHETTTYQAAGKTFISGLKGATFSSTHEASTTLLQHLDGIEDGLSGGGTVSFQFGPFGTTVGNIQYTGEGNLASYSIGAPVGDKVSVSAEWQITGDVVVGTY